MGTAVTSSTPPTWRADPMKDALRRFAVTVFHQDYDLDAPTPDDSVLGYVARASADTLSDVVARIDALLASSLDEEQIDDLWVNKLHANYDPRDDGLTYRE